jgi:hypothetical protein
MADDSTTIELSRSELREVAGYAVACAWPALPIFERERPDDRRSRAAIEAAQAFADGGERTKALRDCAWSAGHAARAFELSAGDDPAVGADRIAQFRILAPPVVVDVLRRYPVAPRGGGRVGELIRQLDASLR